MVWAGWTSARRRLLLAGRAVWLTPGQEFVKHVKARFSAVFPRSDGGIFMAAIPTHDPHATLPFAPPGDPAHPRPRGDGHPPRRPRRLAVPLGGPAQR